MTTRRQALKVLGATAIAPKVLLAEEQRINRSRWDLIFGGHDTVPAPEKPDWHSWDNSTITAAWIGHATVLINFFGTWIITDPVFSERAGINILRLVTIGPKRLVAPALTIKELPPIDLVLLSHAHMDHLDLPSLRKFRRDIPTVMAKNTKDIIDQLGWKNVQEVEWGQKIQIGDVAIEGLQVRHFGWRFPWEDDRSKGVKDGRSFNACLISKNDKHIVFGGDTAYTDLFRRQFADRNLEIELAIMPIGAYDPWIAVHANPEQAAEMAHHIRAKAIMPIHWATFILSNEPTNEPIERLKSALTQSSMSLAVERIGGTWTMAKTA